MASLDLPRLRALHPYRVEHEGSAGVAFQDPLGLVPAGTVVPLGLFLAFVSRFDGRTSLPELRARAIRDTGQIVSAETLDRIVAQLDSAFVLDGPAFAACKAAYRAEHTRPAALAGKSYAATERALRAQLGRFFAHDEGAGLPSPIATEPDGRLRGVLSPHIDFHRGGPVYTWSYRELVERSTADVFVILGVAHQSCEHRFVLTRKNFETPLGLARTDRGYVDRIAALAGDHLFDDELVHRAEHSIEFQVVFLQYLLGGRREFSIVPILVGSFHDLMAPGIDPIDDREVRRFVDALRAAESASSGTVAYIGGIDLGHVGREFGDPNLVDDATLEELREFDALMLDHAAASDPAAWFRRAAGVHNRWRICGLAATYTMLHAMGPASGRLLRYDQAVNSERTCCVSFASLAFHALDNPADNAAKRLVPA
jgi:AmmeMemoRadiSam system protein B